jgi:hypothetical protein
MRSRVGWRSVATSRRSLAPAIHLATPRGQLGGWELSRASGRAEDSPAAIRPARSEQPGRTVTRSASSPYPPCSTSHLTRSSADVVPRKRQSVPANPPVVWTGGVVAASPRALRGITESDGSRPDLDPDGRCFPRSVRPVLVAQVREPRLHEVRYLAFAPLRHGGEVPDRCGPPSRRSPRSPVTGALVLPLTRRNPSIDGPSRVVRSVLVALPHLGVCYRGT